MVEAHISGFWIDNVWYVEAMKVVLETIFGSQQFLWKHHVSKLFRIVEEGVPLKKLQFQPIQSMDGHCISK
jgi:hypothetical protein